MSPGLSSSSVVKNLPCNAGVSASVQDWGAGVRIRQSIWNRVPQSWARAAPLESARATTEAPTPQCSEDRTCSS